MNKGAYLSDDEIMVLIMATSRYLESLGEELSGYPDEKPTPDKLRTMAEQLKIVANLRDVAFSCRENGYAIKLDVEKKEDLSV